MNFEFLDFHGLSTFFAQLKNLFATKSDVTQVQDDTNLYITEVDYSQLEFDKTALIE